jgi:transposase
MFNNTEIEYSRRETHLGLVRTSDGKSSEAVTERIKVGRRTAYDLMGAGLHGMNGITPHISKTLISVYVDPAVLYG